MTSGQSILNSALTIVNNGMNWEGKELRCYMLELTPHDEYNYYAPQICTNENKKKEKVE